MPQNPTREAHLNVNIFKGVNLTDPSHVIDDREFESITNLIINDAGDLIRRKPMRFFHRFTNDPIQMVGLFYGRLMVTDSDDVLLFPTDTDFSNTPITVSGNGDAHDGPLGVLYNNSVHVLTGSTTPAIFGVTMSSSDWGNDSPSPTDVTYTNESVVNNCCKGVIFKDRMFTFRRPDQRSSRVFYSNINDPSTWNSNQFFDVNPGDGDYVTDLLVFGERLFIFKKDSTWVLIHAADPAAWTLRQFDKSVGSVSPYCTLEYRGLFYTISRNGMYRCDGVVYDYVGYPIQKRLQDFPFVDQASVVDSLYRTQLVMVDDYLFFNSADDDIGMWFYNPVQQAWSECVVAGVQPSKVFLGVHGHLNNGTSGTWFTMSNPPSDNDLVWFGFGDPDYPANTEYSDYPVHHDTPASRVITPIHTAFKTKKWDMGNMWRSKRHKYTVLELQVPEQASIADAEFTTRYNFDRVGVSADHELKVDQFNRGNQAHKIPGFGYHRRLQFELESDTPLNFSITGYDLTYFNKRVMVGADQ